MNIDKPYRLTRKYYKHDTIKTYTHDFAKFDHVYKSLVDLIDESTSYTFDLHRLVVTRPDHSKVVCELRNESKPCIIPIREVIFSHAADPKCV